MPQQQVTIRLAEFHHSSLKGSLVKKSHPKPAKVGYYRVLILPFQEKRAKVFDKRGKRGDLGLFLRINSRIVQKQRLQLSCKKTLLNVPEILS